ncbi:hypothetical protein B0T20DRAFT_450498 [Sordaria brevicollis]|uniref:Cytochrome B pre-mRNA-processing protein 6 n=1 Tax=Sordaria brevicollis TaxID=83679 RepID=A0AAE0PJY4_SORBR|nr:hypothetical protein B0T20DRAFT_450498 [Sordaria brevicollis]
MSGALRNLAARQYQRALSEWPRDALRPECQLQDVLTKRLTKNNGSLLPNTSAFNKLTKEAKEQAEIKQANALLSLLENRYKSKYRITGELLKPKSNPKYYSDLVKELEEAPNRTFFGRMAKRLGGIIRFQS